MEGVSTPNASIAVIDQFARGETLPLSIACFALGQDLRIVDDQNIGIFFGWGMK
jgi:hypothetical protein